MLRVRFVTGDDVREVDCDESETLMRLAVDAGIPGVEGECGGSMSCATCHLYIDMAWTDRVGPPGEDEEVMLEFAEDVQQNSRLSCQITLTTELDGLVVHVPQ